MKAENKQNKISGIGKIYIWILLIIFGGIVLHTPVTVWLGTIFPNCSLLVKSWKEILMLIAGAMALFLLYKNKQFKLLREPVIVAIGIYAFLHLIMLVIFQNGLTSTVAGLAIDLRYLLFFVLVYIALKMYPEYRNVFIKIGIAGALIVLVFAILQVFILPADILKYLGYSKDTISPYLTVDLNSDYIRINSTLRGPNPLGAYAGIALTLITSAILKRKIVKKKWSLILVGVLIAGGLAALWASYSRSALIGTLVAIAVVLFVNFWRKLSLKAWLIIGAIALVISGGFLAVSNTSFISNVVFHENPTEGNSVNSNEGHFDSLKSGVTQLISQPLGAGVGSTGSASLLGNNPEIIENQYLFTAHEVGWLGVGIFIYIFTLVLCKLWKHRKNWLVLGVFASGIGLALIGLLLPVWVDDTVAIIWWGLAAIALTTVNKEYN